MVSWLNIFRTLAKNNILTSFSLSKEIMQIILVGTFAVRNRMSHVQVMAVALKTTSPGIWRKELLLTTGRLYGLFPPWLAMPTGVLSPFGAALLPYFFVRHFSRCEVNMQLVKKRAGVLGNGANMPIYSFLSVDMKRYILSQHGMNQRLSQ